MANNIPITNGQGQSSVAAEEISGQKYQKIKVVGGETGSTSVWGIAPDSSGLVSVIGVLRSAILGGAGSSSNSIDQETLIYNDGEGNSTARANPIGSAGYVFNGNNWDRARGNSIIGALVSTGPSSVLTIPTGSVITVLQSSSIIGVVTGSVITVPSNSSVLVIPTSSTIGVWQAASIAGTYFDDAAHEQEARGLGILGVRNDGISSTTSGDNDYSHFAVGPSGETITANAPLTKWVRGTADMRGVGALGGSVTVIAAQGASIFTYVTSAQFVNIGGASVLVTIAGGLGSTLGYTIAPAGGGSNIYYPNALKTGENSAVTASISGVASILVSLQGFIAKI